MCTHLLLSRQNGMWPGQLPPYYTHPQFPTLDLATQCQKQESQWDTFAQSWRTQEGPFQAASRAALDGCRKPRFGRAGTAAGSPWDHLAASSCLPFLFPEHKGSAGLLYVRTHEPHSWRFRQAVKKRRGRLRPNPRLCSTMASLPVRCLGSSKQERRPKGVARKGAWPKVSLLAHFFPGCSA